MPYGDNTLDSGVRDERGEEGWILWVRIPGGECARFNAVVLGAYKECLALD